MDVIIINDISSYLPIITDIYVKSTNLPVDIYVSTSFVTYTNISNMVYFTLLDSQIRQVIYLTTYYLVIDSVLSFCI